MTNKNLKGFTLTEIIVALIIVATISGFATVKFVTVLEQYHASEGEQILLVLLGAQKRYSIDNNGQYATSRSQLDIQVRSSPYFVTPTVANNAAPGAVALIQRNASYRLDIDELGIIRCSGGSGNICSKLGY